MDATFARRYRDVRTWRPRGAFRRVALDCLSWWQGGARALAESQHVARIQIVNLHHVFDDEVEPFRGLVRQLSRTFRFISYSEAVRRIATGQIDEAFLSFSFDDGLKNCLNAAAVLNEYGARGCFFVCPAMVAERSWERIRAFCRDRLEMPPCEFLNWSDLESLQLLGHEIGAHTVHHLDLGRLPFDQAENEIGFCREVLTRRCGQADHFAWPFGTFANFSPWAARSVFRAGFKSCASGVRGCHGGAIRARHPSELCLRRDQILATWPFRHVAYFLAQAAQQPLVVDQLWPRDWRFQFPVTTT